MNFINALIDVLKALFNKKPQIEEKKEPAKTEIKEDKTMNYGSRILKLNDTGEDVQELQIRLAGFGGTVFGGTFGPNTEKQVKQFQTDFMKVANVTGIVDKDTFIAIDKFADQYLIDFTNLKCSCGACKGFGQGLYKDKYIDGKPQLEMYYMYEYPGIHRAILWAARAAFFYNSEFKFSFNAGYRCSVNNQQHNRTSTNHCGKAVDMDTLNIKNEVDDKSRCNKIRDILVQRSNAQIGWTDKNRKSLEPADIAPTWVHYDVRNYDKEYLLDSFFCQNLEQLNKRIQIVL